MSTRTVSMPGMAGITGAAPVASTMARAVSTVSLPSAAVIATDQGLIRRAWPRRTSTPRPV